MSVCRKCQARNGGGDGFCTVCRAYLGYWGRPTLMPSPRPELDRSAQPARPAQPTPAPAGGGPAPAPAGSGPAPASAGGRPVPIDDRMASARSAAEARSRRAAALADDPAERNRSDAAPRLAGQAVADRAPGGAVGSSPTPSTTTTASTTARARRSGRCCPECRSADLTNTVFCDHCGADLDPVSPAGATTRRPGRRRPHRRFVLRSRVSASQEPPVIRLARAVRRARSLSRRAVVVVVAVCALLGLGPYRTRLTHQVDAWKASLLPHPVYVQASTVSIGGSTRGTVGNLNDRSASTAWIGPPGASVRFTFAVAMRLFVVGILNGAASTNPGYEADGRAWHVEVQAYDAAGRQVAERTITVADRPSFQQFRVSGKSVSAVTITFLDGWKGPHPSLGVREIELYRRN